MTNTTDLPAPSESEAASRKTALGFWIYLMTDSVLFATLFASYAVLQGNTFGGPSAAELFNLPFILIATLILLTSSFTGGLAMVALNRGNKQLLLIWLGITGLLGAVFLGMEIVEFSKLIHEGNSWTRSGFLSAFFTLVGTHGLHIVVGLIWIIVLSVHIVRRGITSSIRRKLNLFSLYWHFLDIVWICIFTFVYLLGGL